jgi:hypothetical protein
MLLQHRRIRHGRGEDGDSNLKLNWWSDPVLRLVGDPAQREVLVAGLLQAPDDQPVQY